MLYPLFKVSMVLLKYFIGSNRSIDNFRYCIKIDPVEWASDQYGGGFPRISSGRSAQGKDAFNSGTGPSTL